MIITMAYSVALSLLYNKHNGNEINKKITGKAKGFLF